jgi:hypothetical protein
VLAEERVWWISPPRGRDDGWRAVFRVWLLSVGTPPVGSVDELQLQSRAVRSPGLEVEPELAAPLLVRGASGTTTSIVSSLTS